MSYGKGNQYPDFSKDRAVPGNPPYPTPGVAYPPHPSTGSPYTPYPTQTPGGGYPPQYAAGGAYPPHAPGGAYPPPSAGGAYPPATAAGAYPPPTAAGAYPPYPSGAAYPPQPCSGGFPPYSADGYHHSPYPQQTGAGYPNYPPGSGMAGPTTVPLKSTVKSFLGFDPQVDSKSLHQAFKGIGCNDNAVSDILTNRSIDQRLKIRTQYDKTYGTLLLERMKSELTGEREKILKALIMSPFDRSAYYIRVAVKNIGTDENCLNDLLGTMLNSEITQVKAAYTKEFSRDIVRDVSDDTSGSYRDALVQLLTATRKENAPLSRDEARGYANELHNSCKGMFNNKKFDVHIRILCRESTHMIHLIGLETSNVYGLTLCKHIETNFTGDLKNLFLDICEYSNSPIEYYAGRLLTAMNAADVRSIGRILVSRCDFDLGNILDAIKKFSKKGFSQIIDVQIPRLDPVMKKTFLALTANN